VKVDTRDDRGWTALHHAATHGHLLVVERLLEAGADPNARNEKGETPLHRAAAGDSTVRKMLTLTPGPQGVQAAENTLDVEIVKRLVAFGADLDAVDGGGHTPVNTAVYEDAGASAEALLKLGASVSLADHRGYTPLHMAALHGPARAVRTLLDLGADPNAQTTAGFTPLDGAREGGQAEIADLLRDRGAWRTKDSAGGADDWIRKGDAAADRGDLEEAVTSFDRALQEHPRSVRAWLHKGDVLNRWNKNERALECYNEAIAIDPLYSDGIAWGNKGYALQDMGRFDEAVECYEHVLQVNPRDARAWTNIGTARKHQGRRAEAIKAYKAALEIDPQHERAREYLAVLSGNDARRETP
jgi:ankyrin repeat protein